MLKSLTPSFLFLFYRYDHRFRNLRYNMMHSDILQCHNDGALLTSDTTYSFNDERVKQLRPFNAKHDLLCCKIVNYTSRQCFALAQRSIFRHLLISTHSLFEKPPSTVNASLCDHFGQTITDYINRIIITSKDRTYIKYTVGSCLITLEKNDGHIKWCQLHYQTPTNAINFNGQAQNQFLYLLLVNREAKQ